MSEYKSTVYRKKTKPLVKPELINGKWIKTCECGCGVVFEVPPKGRGNARYATAKCKEKMRQVADEARREERYGPLNSRTCRKCGQRKGPDGFLDSKIAKNRNQNTCKDCMPFTMVWDDGYMPACGTYEGYDDFAESAVCPLYKNCRARQNNPMAWLPCEAPIRQDLIAYVFSSPEEKSKLRELISWKFDSKGRPIKDSPEKWLEYYYKLGERIQNERPEPMAVPSKKPVSVYHNL